VEATAAVQQPFEGSTRNMDHEIIELQPHPTFRLYFDTFVPGSPGRVGNSTFDREVAEAVAAAIG